MLIRVISQVQLYFMANIIKEKTFVAVFISVVGSKMHTILRDLVKPKKPQEKMMLELMKILLACF